MEKDILFLVWYDKEIREIMSIEKINSTKALETQLAKEGIQVSEIMAPNFKEANKIFLEGFEQLKPDAQFMASNSDISSNAIEKISPQGVNLDTLFDSLDKPIKPPKLH